MDQPLVSVIIPTFNRAGLLRRALQSVLSQTYMNFEALVIDDFSAEDIHSVVDSFDDLRIKYFRNPFNAGVAFSRNRGIELSKGTYISFLDSDDFFLPEFLERSVKKMLSVPEQVGFIWTGFTVHGLTGRAIYTTTWKPPLNNGYQIFLKNLRVGTGCGLTFKRCFLETVKFNPALRAAEDTEFFLRLVQICRYDFVDSALIVINKHEGERVTGNLRATLATYLVILKVNWPAISERQTLRLKYYDKIMTLAYKTGKRKLGRMFFVKALPTVLFRPKTLVKFFFFELGHRANRHE